MNVAMYFKNLCLVVVLLAVVVCGTDHLPIALKPVNPALNSDGSLHALDLREQSLSNTLLDSVVNQGVPRPVATVAFAKYDAFQSHVHNTGYISVIDFTLHSGKPRFYMINTSSGHVDAILVAHGKNSDPNDDGVATRFSNVPNSKESSLGAYLVAERFVSSVHGNAARMDGLENSNDLARPRAIVLHSAAYVTNSRTKMGRSWGCPAVSFGSIAAALSNLTGGSFLYAYGPSKSAKALARDEATIQSIMLNPAYKWIDESAE